VLNGSDKALALARHGTGLGARVVIAGGVLLLEKSFLNLFVDFDSAQTAEGLGAVVRVIQHWGFRFITSFAIAAILFAYLRAGRELEDLGATARVTPLLRPRWLIAHLALLAPLVPLSSSLYGERTWLPLGAIVALWLSLAILAALALFAALAPWALWQRVIRAIGPLWGYAFVAAAGAALAMGLSQGLWAGMTNVTFEAVYRLLDRLVPALQVDPANKIIDTGRFAVEIAPVCSGLEGMGLMLAFCATLLLLFRREYIFPRALLLIPAALVLSFMLNIARIAGLVLIGNAGYAGIAAYGFHSQAGWIAFNAAAVGIAFMSLRSRWFSRAATSHGPATLTENPTAAYLLPYLALLLAGMVSHAASGGFESLYWIRLLLAGAALGYCWPRIHDVDWRFSWRGVAAGAVAFGVWIVAARVLVPSEGLPAAIAALPTVSRVAWITGHILVSVALIPVVEELAFRGYLLRRIQAADFESVSPGQVSALALIVSAVVFGLCQGVFWLPGMVSGAIFGLLYMRTGRLGEAWVAHALGNAALAAVVLGGSQWQLW
jgi:exosortase E/protease (VPEID-CTERM system)